MNQDAKEKIARQVPELLRKFQDACDAQLAGSEATFGDWLIEMLACQAKLKGTAQCVDEGYEKAAAFRAAYEDLSGAKWPGSGA